MPFTFPDPTNLTAPMRSATAQLSRLVFDALTKFNGSGTQYKNESDAEINSNSGASTPVDDLGVLVEGPDCLIESDTEMLFEILVILKKSDPELPERLPLAM